MSLYDVTVAIATCDRPDALARCLAAVYAGDMLPAQIIVVDQSAADASREVVGRFRSAPVAPLYIRQPRLGLSASRNAAFAAATHPVVAVTDDDCVPARDWVAVVQQAFSSHTPPAALTGRVLPYGTDEPGLHAVSLRPSARPVEYRRTSAPWAVGTGGNFAALREWIERIGGYDERLGAGSPGRAAEDTDVLYRLLRAGAPVRYEPRALVYHDRQSARRRLAGSCGYGYGIGACCAIWLRGGDWRAVAALCRWLAFRACILCGALLRRKWLYAVEECLVFRGTLGGLGYGVRCGARHAH